MPNPTSTDSTLGRWNIREEPQISFAKKKKRVSGITRLVPKGSESLNCIIYSRKKNRTFRFFSPQIQEIQNGYLNRLVLNKFSPSNPKKNGAPPTCSPSLPPQRYPEPHRRQICRAPRSAGSDARRTRPGTKPSQSPRRKFRPGAGHGMI